VHPGEYDHARFGGRGLARQTERVAYVIGHILDFRTLVVMSEDDRLSCPRKAADLGLEGGDLLRSLVRDLDYRQAQPAVRRSRGHTTSRRTDPGG
jgi:hypothetical protein